MCMSETEGRISILGEFADKTLEKEFFNHYMGKAIKYIKPISLVLGILYLLFIIPDYFNIKDQGTFLVILANRVIFLLLVIVLFLACTKVKNYETLAFWITVYEVMGVISFMIIFGLYENPNFLIQAFGVMILVMGIFLVPNKFINTLVTSCLITVAFFALSYYNRSALKPSEYLAGIVYILIVLVLSSISSFRNNCLNRKEYRNSKELLLLSTTDQLTHIYNRARFNEELEQWIRNSKEQKRLFSVAIFDIDNFKNVNDRLGHLAGDKVLVGIADAVQASIRQGDFFARWGGDEFVLLLPDTDRQEATEITERLKTLISDNIFETVGRVTCSFGIAVSRENDNAEVLLERADTLLYKAKDAGRNIVVS